MIGAVVKHGGWGFENDVNYPCDVLIISGEYDVPQPFGGSRISNFWYWKRVLPDGTLNNTEEHGYGDFIESDNEYRVVTTTILERGEKTITTELIKL